ncbi:MAG: hypothetical protein ACAH95_16770 [Fimbriimonas sp.]
MAAYMPGQREVVLGVLPYNETMMQLIWQTDKQASFPTYNGDVIGGGLAEQALGWVKWSVKTDTWAGKPCMVLRCEGNTKEALSKTLKVDIRDIKSWWVDGGGKILRQYEQQIRPFVTRTANCVYQKDSIDVSVEDEKGRRQTSVFPNVEMDELHAQFKPMWKDGKVLLDKKDYYVFNPFEGGFDKYTARLAGWAGGSYFNMKFVGKAFEITGPRLVQTAGISEEGDLIHVQLPKDRYIVMQALPQGKIKKPGTQ